MELIEAVQRESMRAARALFRARSFSVIAALTLALGLGAATTIFTVLDCVVIRPLPYPHPERLVQLTTLRPKVAALASLGPARRAAKIDPVEAMRTS